MADPHDTFRRASILSFSGEFGFLSNFHFSPFHWDGVDWSTVEHAFQAAKTLDPEQRQAMAQIPTPGDVKKAGRSLSLRSDWEDVKYGIMAEVVYEKFRQNPTLRAKLLATGNAHLEEGNHHGDRIWGTVDGEGTNWLGKILMEVRETLRNESTSE